MDCSELSKNLTQIAMNIGSRPGVKNIDDVLKIMQKDFPNLRRESLVDAIAEATSGTKRETDELLNKLRAIRQEARVDRALSAKIKRLERHLETGTLPSKIKRIKDASYAIQQLREIRDDLRKKLTRSAEARKQRLQKSIDILEEKIKTGDILPTPRIEPVTSKELELLEFQKRRLQQKIRAQINELKPKTVWEHIAEPFNAARSIITSIDLSAVLRQGGFVVFSHPVRAARPVPAMLKALTSEQKAIKVNDEIFERPNAPLYQKSKLFLAPIDGSEKLTKMEEVFMSKWAEKIPLVRASERAYLTYLNQLRADSFDTMASTLSKDGNVTKKEADAIADFVNIATGRGKLGALEQASVPLNTLFFAPRYSASRFQLLSGKPLWQGTARTRKLIAKEYGKYLIGLSLVYALGMAAGGDVEDDPTSPDFGKIRFGKTRLDPLSGISQTAVLLSRLALGKTKSSITGKVRPIRGEDRPYGGFTSFDIMSRFLRGKLSPMIGTGVNALTGENVIGEKVTPLTTVRDLTVPLSLRDIYEVMVDQGVTRGTALSALAIFGAGLQTYGQKISDENKKKILRPKRPKQPRRIK